MGVLSETIRRFPNEIAPKDWEDWVQEQAFDNRVVRSVGIESDPGRKNALRDWLNKYRVLRVRADSHNAICESILLWRDKHREICDLSTAKGLDEAHRSLEGAIVSAYGTQRSFRSLASKALWLCYPERVPIYDGQAKLAVSILSKLESLSFDFPEGSTEYFKFCSAWLKLYERYSAELESVDSSRYHYRYRLFDMILWEVGMGGYGIRGPNPS